MNDLNRLQLPSLYLFETWAKLFFDIDRGRVIIFLSIFTFETYRRQYYVGSCKVSISPRDVIGGGMGICPPDFSDNIFF